MVVDLEVFYKYKLLSFSNPNDSRSYEMSL